MEKKEKIILYKISNCLKKHFLDHSNFDPQLLQNVLLEIYEPDVIIDDHFECQLRKLCSVRNTSSHFYVYNPPIKNVTSKESFMRVLSERFAVCGGGFFLDDVELSMPNASAILKSLETENKIAILGGVKKRKSVFSTRDFNFLRDKKFDILKEIWSTV